MFRPNFIDRLLAQHVPPVHLLTVSLTNKQNRANIIFVWFRQHPLLNFLRGQHIRSDDTLQQNIPDLISNILHAEVAPVLINNNKKRGEL